MLLTSYGILEQRSEQIAENACPNCLEEARSRIVTLYEKWGKADEAERWQRPGSTDTNSD